MSCAIQCILTLYHFGQHAAPMEIHGLHYESSWLPAADNILTRSYLRRPDPILPATGQFVRF